MMRILETPELDRIGISDAGTAVAPYKNEEQFA